MVSWWATTAAEPTLSPLRGKCLGFNYLEMIVFDLNPLVSRHKLAIKKGYIMQMLGHAFQEVPQPEPQVNPLRTGNKY